ncbi:MAG: TerB family tellurite resistance protein [Pseudomonadota bacterium]
MIKNLSAWLLPADGEGTVAEPTVSPRCGAAGLLVVAAHRNGTYSEIEKDLAAAALMKLFMMSNPEAKELRKEAEDALSDDRRMTTFAHAAQKLDREEQEALVSHLWRLVEEDGDTDAESVLVSTIRDRLGFSPAQADALRPAKVS